MGKIIAIGGGSKDNILPIDSHIVKLTNKANPNLLFIPSASDDSEEYINYINEQFGKKLNCNVDVLYLLKRRPSIENISTKFRNADIIYVGGGNTLKMMNLWRKLRIDKFLHEAYNAGKIMSGVSAGSICWFKFGNSDSRKFKNADASLIKVRGLGIIDAVNCPHYDSEADRKESLKEMMRKSSGVAIALQDYCALEINDDMYRIISSVENANAYKVYWEKNEFFECKLEKDEYQPLNRLLIKGID